MMPVAALAEMRARGVVFVVDGEWIRYRAPAGVVNERTLAYLRRHKPSLLALLRDEAERDPDAARLAAAVAIFDADIAPGPQELEPMTTDRPAPCSVISCDGDISMNVKRAEVHARWR